MIREYSNKDKPKVIELLRKNTPEYFDISEENDFENYLENEIEDYYVFEENSKINIIHKSNKYEFKLLKYAEIGDNLAYVLSYYPRGSADFEGKIYVNTEDFAVLRIDYENAKNVYDKQFNMFGVNVNHIKFEGSMHFQKYLNSNKY